jgi:predicted acylesterase/phospholipase RssA
MNEAPTNGTPDPGIALALGSAFLGIYAHGGFLCGLNKVGVFPGHIAGASAGAMAGGFYAAGMRGDELEAAVLSGALKRSYPDIGMVLRGAPMFFIGRLTGLMNGKRLVKYLERELPVSAIEDTPGVKLKIAVTDLKAHKGIFLNTGPLAQSMMASCSVPILFTDQRIAGTRYHDGGILHELPIDPYINDPAIHTIIVHSISYPTGDGKLGVSAPFSRGHQMMNDALFAFRRAEAERNGKRVILVETGHPHPGILQTKAAKKRYFEEGELSGLSLGKELPI